MDGYLKKLMEITFVYITNKNQTENISPVAASSLGGQVVYGLTH